ncbi:hypothetical protein AVEN_58779-1 [Araneus ventricosus]|uniref:Uncharacterized protein n=1 Tax=Araneus ventricosus TaxID=182803 RepID=A0A4Y2GJU0_ARAVE|nr:hypothetical protein AVEN_58779-1 [Araneus ventricosus]
MVRNYKPKKDIKFLEVKINEDESKIENESLSMRAAAIAVEIPFNFTLSLKEVKESITVVKHVEAVPYIPAEYENELAACLQSVARWGIERS